MLWTVVRMDARNVRAEVSAWLALLLLATGVTYAAWSGAAAVHADRQAVATALTEQQTRMRDLQVRLHAVQAGQKQATSTEDPSDPALVGSTLAAVWAVLPQLPLASVAVGQRDLAAARVRITTQGPSGRSLQSDRPMTGPTRLLTGAFDLAFVLVALLPLVIIVLTYDLLAGERERGTLALVLAHPVSLATFVLGKALQRGLLLGSVTLGLALLAVAATVDGPWTSDDAVRMLLYLGTLMAYVGFWFAAAVAINVRGQTSAGNALALIGLWLALVVIVPGIVQVAVQATHPPPSRVELVNLTRAAASEIEAELSDLQGNHGADGKGTPAQNAQAATERLVAVQVALEKRAAPVLQAFGTQLAAQQALVNALRFLSPAIVLQEALGDVAGNGGHRLQQFHSQVDEFGQRWRNFFFSRVSARQRLTVADYAALPQFVFREESLPALGTRVGAGLMGLLLPTLLLIGWAGVGLRRGVRVM